MDQTIILYRSKTGFSQRYAQWLAEDLGCGAVPYQERAGVVLGKYNTIILVGGLYAGQMAGLKWLEKQLPQLVGKRIAAVAVGCSPADNPELPGSMQALFGRMPQIQGFYCQGGLDYVHMGWLDRAMMAVLRATLRGKTEKAAMLEGISDSFDASDRAYLEPVIRWAKRT